LKLARKPVSRAGFGLYRAKIADFPLCLLNITVLGPQNEKRALHLIQNIDMIERNC
jgi:hypothetical protein